MLIPLRHENMEGRWPVVTFALMALNVWVFLGTHWQMESQTLERAEVRMHIILLAGHASRMEDLGRSAAIHRCYPEENSGTVLEANRPFESEA